MALVEVVKIKKDLRIELCPFSQFTVILSINNLPD